MTMYQMANIIDSRLPQNKKALKKYKTLPGFRVITVGLFSVHKQTVKLTKIASLVTA